MEDLCLIKFLNLGQTWGGDGGWFSMLDLPRSLSEILRFLS